VEEEEDGVEEKASVREGGGGMIDWKGNLGCSGQLEDLVD